MFVLKVMVLYTIMQLCVLVCFLSTNNSTQIITRMRSKYRTCALTILALNCHFGLVLHIDFIFYMYLLQTMVWYYKYYRSNYDAIIDHTQ